MTVTAAASTVGATGSQTTLDPFANLSQDYTTFLKLLTTQLKNQDPTNPMDSSQFTNQLVQFASVEQEIKANTNLQSLISLQQAGQAQQALNYLGKVGEIGGNQIPLVNSQGAFSYTLSGPSDSTTIKITDANGNVVRTVAGATTVGKHLVTWDGTDDSGNTVPDGTYTVTIAPTRADGTTITATTTAYGVISSVQTDATGMTTLSMGNLQVTPDKILSVNGAIGSGAQQIATAPPASSTTPPASGSTT